MKWRWLVVVGVSVMLSACANMFPPCGMPGGVNKESKETCYYLLTVTQKDHEVRGHVAKSVVQANIDRLPWHDNYTIKDYQFIEYPIPLSKPDDKEKLELYKDYWFVGTPGSPLLRLTADDDLPPHQNDVPKSALSKSR
jgi:hypothetical protein